MAGESLEDRQAVTLRRINDRRPYRRSNVVNKLIRLFVIAATILAIAESSAAQQNQGAAPPQGRGNAPGRGARPQGPPGPVPRLPDGRPDLTGIWNGFVGGGARGADAPNMLPWATKVVADRRANQGAEDFEARCLPGGPP